jgi:hypothetical protein
MSMLLYGYVLNMICSQFDNAIKYIQNGYLVKTDILGHLRTCFNPNDLNRA